MSAYSYPIFKLGKKLGILYLWDGPHLTLAEAKRLLRIRQKQERKSKFFIVRLEHQE